MRSLLALPCFVLAAACATLDPADLGRCGNGIVEPGEACDAPNAPEDQFGTGLSCGKPGLPNECRLLAKEGSACPAGSHRGEDGVCRGPTGEFDRLGGLDATVLQLVEREQDPYVLVRRGNDLEVLSISRAGAATLVADGANLASGLRALGELPDDERPLADRVQPLLPSGNLLVPLPTRSPDGFAANSIGLFPVSGSGFVAAVQTSVPTVEGSAPIDLQVGASLVATPRQAGTTVADLGYLSLADASDENELSLCVNGECFPLAKQVTVPRVVASEPLAYTSVDASPRMFGVSTMNVLGVTVATAEGERVRGLVMDAPSGQLGDRRFSLQDVGANVGLCGDPGSALEDVLTCAIACVDAPTVPPSCNCENPFADPSCTDPVPFAIHADRVFATVVLPTGIGIGVAVYYSARFRISSVGEEFTFVGTFRFEHYAPGDCANPVNCEPTELGELESASLLPEGTPTFVETGAFSVADDLTGDGAPEGVVFSAETSALFVSLSEPFTTVQLPLDAYFGIADANGDGLADILGARGASIVVILGGSTLPFVEVPFVLDAPPREVRFADLDADGVRDFVVRTAGEDPGDGSCPPGTVYVVFGASSLSEPIPVGSGTCIEEMLPLRLVQSGDGISDVAFLRRQTSTETMQVEWSLGALLGSTSRFLTSPVPLGPLDASLPKLEALVAFAGGVGAESSVEGALLLVKRGQSEGLNVARALLTGDQLAVEDVSHPMMGPLLVSGESLVAPTSDGRVVVWDGGVVHVVGVGDPPTQVDLSSLGLGQESRALLGGRGGRDFVLFALRDADGQPEVDVAVAVSGVAELVTSEPCYTGTVEPRWLSDTELSVCGLVISLENVDLECTFADGGVGIGPVEPESALVTAGRAFSYDVDRDGLLDRIESTSGEILKQSECLSSGDVTFGN
jgi:hypothetical protein